MVRKLLIAAALSGFLLVGGVTPSQARDRCEQRVRKAESNLRKAVRRHGMRSRQAERRRYELERVRRECRFDYRYRDYRDDHYRDYRYR